MNREPLINVATLTAATGAIIGLLIAFGVPFTDAQKIAILAATTIAAPLIVAAIARTKVAAWTTVAAQLNTNGTITAGPATGIPTGTPVDITTTP